MSQEIAVIANLKPIEIFGADKIDPIIGKIEEEVRSFHFDISTPGGRKDIASLAHKVARSKTALDAMGKGLTDEARAGIDAINAERRTMRDRLDDLKEEIRRPLTEWEDKEKNRVAAHEGALVTLSAMIAFDAPPSSAQASARVEELKAFFKDRPWEEFEAPAKAAFEKNEQALLQMSDDLAQREAEQVELERLRKEKEEREAKERDERIAREAAEKAKSEAEAKAKAEADAAKAKADAEHAEFERKAKEEREAAERQRVEAEDKAKAEREEIERKAQAERDESERQRVADKEKIEAAEKATKDAKAKAKQDAEDATRKERERAEAEKASEAKAAAEREANKKHRAKINTEALVAFKQAGLGESDAKMAVEAIAKQQIPNVTIAY